MADSGDRSSARVLLLLVAAVLGACIEDEGDRGEALSAHEEPSDLVPYSNEKFDGALGSFDAKLIVDDLLFENADAVTLAALQDLLEHSPYGNRSFLADEVVDGRPFSEVLLEVAQAHELNPVLLLTRMQVEKSLVSKTKRPSANSVDFALGCGCPDGSSCNPAFRGLDQQLDCGADVLREHFDGSVAGTGAWVKGKAKKTLDGRTVTPASHATASFYAYTPWVLQGSGGNWLVWNVTRKYIGTLLDRGTYDLDDGTEPEEEPMPDPTPTGSCVDHCDSSSAVPLGDGEACFCDDLCTANGDCCDDFAEACGEE